MIVGSFITQQLIRMQPECHQCLVALPCVSLAIECPIPECRGHCAEGLHGGSLEEEGWLNASCQSVCGNNEQSSVQPVPLGGSHSQRLPSASHPNKAQFLC